MVVGFVIVLEGVVVEGVVMVMEGAMLEVTKYVAVVVVPPKSHYKV